jgi:four helix bundle protein
MSENIILTKTYDFSLGIIKLYKTLSVRHNEYILSKQLLRSGTSIGANTEEAVGAQSKKDFIHKFSIAYKEARETKYWLRLLKDSEYIDDSEASTHIARVDEILKIITAIQKTTKQNISNQ